MPPTEPLAVFHLAEEGAFSEGLVQAARVPDDGRGFIVVLDDDLRTRQMRDCRAAARSPTQPAPEPHAKIQSGNAFSRIARHVEGTPSPLPTASQHSRVLRAPSRGCERGNRKSYRRSVAVEQSRPFSRILASARTMIPESVRPGTRLDATLQRRQ